MMKKKIEKTTRKTPKENEGERTRKRAKVIMEENQGKPRTKVDKDYKKEPGS